MHPYFTRFKFFSLLKGLAGLSHCFSSHEFCSACKNHSLRLHRQWFAQHYSHLNGSNIVAFRPFMFIPGFTLRVSAGQQSLGLETTSDSFSTLRQDQPRSKIQSRHLVLDRPPGRFPAGATRRTCLANLPWDILGTWPNHHGRNLSVPRSDSVFTALRIRQLRIMSRTIMPWTLWKNPTSASCTWELR